MQECLPLARIERYRLAIPVDAGLLKPSEKFRGGTKVKELANRQRVMKAGGLVVEHDIVRAGHPHEVIAARGRKQKHKIISGVLVGHGVIGVADVASHRQPQQLSHEVIFQSGANDLALVVEIFGPNEAYDAIDQEWIKGSSDAISTRFEGQLVDPVMGLGGEGAALTGFEIHHVVANPRNIASAVMFENTHATFPQHGQIDSKTF